VMLTWRIDRQNTLRRFLKFNLVGALGMVVQMGVLYFFASRLRANYLLATALAVETAVLHNFIWHERFTWADCGELTARPALGRLLRFNLTTGAISVTGNLVVMSLLVGLAHLRFLVANLVTIALCSLLNFVVSDRLIFRACTNHQGEVPRSVLAPHETRRAPRVPQRTDCLRSSSTGQITHGGSF
jgi:putative flippase GtrA